MNALVIARRDLVSYLQGYLAYVIFAALLLFHGLFFTVWALAPSESQLSFEVIGKFFYLCWGFTVATAIVVTMRSLAAEYTMNTEVLLRTSIVQDAEIAVGKWLAAMGLVSIYMALTIHMPLLVVTYGKVSFAHLAVGYTGVFLGGSAAAAMGVFFSALFRNQLAALIVGALFAIFFAIIAWRFAAYMEPPFSDVLEYISVFQEHFVPFMEGRISLSGVVYQVAFTALFLLLSTQVLHTRRWE